MKSGTKTKAATIEWRWRVILVLLSESKFDIIEDVRSESFKIFNQDVDWDCCYIIPFEKKRIGQLFENDFLCLFSIDLSFHCFAWIESISKNNLCVGLLHEFFITWEDVNLTFTLGPGHSSFLFHFEILFNRDE